MSHEALSPYQRAFLNGLVERLSKLDRPEPEATMDAGARAAFLGRFVALAQGLPNADTAADHVEAFRRHIIEPWQGLVWRITGASARQLADLEPSQHRMLRVLEDAPNLLQPLGLVRDELTHGRLLHWVFTLDSDDEVGAACRKAWLQHCELDGPTSGWQVKREFDVAPHGRLDVRIAIPGHLLQYIEMKVDAPEAPGQLLGYRTHLEGMPMPNHVGRSLVFLTPSGRKGDPASRALPMSFADLVRIWLPAATLPTPSGAYLGAWLSSIARGMLGISGSGPFATWLLSTQVRTLRMLQHSTSKETT